MTIGEWILKSACSQMMKWQEQGVPTIHVCVNISPRQLNDPGFASMVRKTLAETGLEPQRLFLEITESMLVSDDPHIHEIISQLHRIGVQWSVDDFGTGYSSLSYIKNYPIDMIKIDRSFIQDVSHNSDDVAIVKAIIDMSNSLQISVLAEGTETLEQIRCLQELGCEVVQGFYYSSPMNAEKFISSYPLLQDTVKRALSN